MPKPRRRSRGTTQRELRQESAAGGALGALDLGERDEFVQGIDADALRRPRLVHILPFHLPVHQDLHLDVLLGPDQDLVDPRGRQGQDLRQAPREAKARGDVLGEVAVLQVGKEVPGLAGARVRQTIVGLVGVHAGLEGGCVRHLSGIAVQVPLLQSAGVGEVEAWHDLLHFPAHGLDFLRHAHKHLLGEVIHALVEERLLVQRLAVPFLRAPAAVHHAGMDDRAWVPQADAQIRGAAGDTREHAEQALQRCEGLPGLRHRRHCSQDAALGAEDRRLPAPLREAARPRQRLEADEDHVVRLLLQLG
mmetsp:Transcript_104142/g.299726  ORF Transcript_104142/g.299726 Transcript_104142/m.299726 type:complete len:306 (+) Transcript_104142:95-1012(+)